MRLFTKDIDKQLFAQYPKGGDLANQKVVAKIFNPYGNGTWYLINSDPNDPDYLWAIVDLFEVEVGSVSRMDLETIKVPPFRLGLERDMSFTPMNAEELYRGLLQGKRYEKGGSVADSNKEMLLNQAEGFEHHAEEFESAVKKADEIPAWVVAKSQRASTDLSDITHYLDGENEQKREMKEGEEYGRGGELSIKVGDKVKSKSGVSGVVYESTGTMFKLEDEFGNKSSKWHSTREFKKADIKTMAKGGKLDIAKIREEYEENEDNNAHSENVVLLAKHFGSEQDLRDAKTILAKHEAIGHLPPYLMKERDDLSKKLYKKMVEHSQGKMAHGGQTPNKQEWTAVYVNQIKPNERKVIVAYGNSKKEATLNARMSEGYHDIKYPYELQDIYTSSGNFPMQSDSMAHGGMFEWQDAKIGDSALVVSENKLGLIVKDYGRKFHLKFPDGREKTYDASELKFIKDEDEYANGGYMAKGGEISGEFKPARYAKDKIAYFPPKGDGMYKNREMRLAEAKGVNGKWSHREKAYIMSKGQSEKLKKYLLEGKDASSFTGNLYEDDEMAMGGVTFDDKVKAVKSSLLKRKKVSPSVQKDYGKTYSPKEAEESAKRIVGAMTAAERLKAKRKNKK